MQPWVVSSGSLAGPGTETGAPASVVIPVRSERQALDWSLALASQGIVCAIRKLAESGGWTLEVDADDAGRALRTLRQYHVENRRWRDAFQVAEGDFPFHWGVLLWCLLQVTVYWAALGLGEGMVARGRFDTSAVAGGDWWRPLTATFLHAGPDHLAANLTTGFLMLGCAMGRFGAGGALLASLVAGVIGNLLAWVWRGYDYTGLGASGVVMGALGMLAVSLLADIRRGRLPGAAFRRGALGGGLLFVLLGTAPQADVLAHLGGFLGGAAMAGLLAVLSEGWRKAERFEVACALVYVAVGVAGWWAALR